MHVVAVQLPQPLELPWEMESFPLLPADIPNTENILWIWSLWQDGQNNFFRSFALRKYSSNFVLHWLHSNSYTGIVFILKYYNNLYHRKGWYKKRSWEVGKLGGWEVGRLRGWEVKIISTSHLLIFSTSAFLLCDLCVFAVTSSLFTVNKPGG